MGDALHAARQAGVYQDGEEAEADYNHVRTVVTLAADEPPTEQDVFLHFFNMCELRREGKGIEEWLAQSGF